MRRKIGRGSGRYLRLPVGEAEDQQRGSSKEESIGARMLVTYLCVSGTSTSTTVHSVMDVRQLICHSVGLFGCEWFE